MKLTHWCTLKLVQSSVTTQGLASRTVSSCRSTSKIVHNSLQARIHPACSWTWDGGEPRAHRCRRALPNVALLSIQLTTCPCISTGTCTDHGMSSRIHQDKLLQRHCRIAWSSAGVALHGWEQSIWYFGQRQRGAGTVAMESCWLMQSLIKAQAALTVRDVKPSVFVGFLRTGSDPGTEPMRIVLNLRLKVHTLREPRARTCETAQCERSLIRPQKLSRRT